MQGDLFGEPTRDTAQSQWFTPPWLAKRLAQWVRPGDRVLEPSCGTGNLIAALMEIDLRHVVLAFELDLAMADHARGRFAGPFSSVHVLHGNFFEAVTLPTLDVALMNPPFEGNAHMRFVRRALDLAPVVLGIFPASFEYGQERDRELWATKAAVTHRARLPERVDYGGDQSPSFDSVALRIIRREQPRGAGEQRQVLEEVWRPGDAG